MTASGGLWLDGSFGPALESRQAAVLVREERADVAELREAVDASPSLLRLDAELEDHRDRALPVHGSARELGAVADGRERRLDGVGRAD